MGNQQQTQQVELPPPGAWRDTMPEPWMGDMLAVCEYTIGNRPNAPVVGQRLYIMVVWLATQLDAWQHYAEQLEGGAGQVTPAEPAEEWEAPDEPAPARRGPAPTGQRHPAQHAPQRGAPAPARQNGNGAQAPTIRDPGAAATDKQIKMIYAVGSRELGWSDTQTDQEAVNKFSVRPYELTKGEASQFIDHLRSLV